jgi:hypothetical protein
MAGELEFGESHSGTVNSAPGVAIPDSYSMLPEVSKRINTRGFTTSAAPLERAVDGRSKSPSKHTLIVHRFITSP